MIGGLKNLNGGYVEDDLLVDSLGRSPEELQGGRCGCDRPRWSVWACGHCACGSECGDCVAPKIWKDEIGGESWCGCADPGNELLPCGHCGCGKGLCLELVRNGAVFVARRKTACEIAV